MKKLILLAAVLAAVGYVFRNECKGMCSSLCSKDKSTVPPENGSVIPQDSNAPV